MSAFSELAPAADAFQPTGLLPTLLTLSLSAVAVLTPRYATDGTTLEDFAWLYLNPAGQRMLGQPKRPAASLLTLFPGAQGTEAFAGYCRAFATGEPTKYEMSYQADGVDGYFLTAAQRHDHLLLVSFTDTNDQPRSAMEVALRESQARERIARAEVEAALTETERQRELLRSALEQAPALNAVLNGPQHHFTLFNELYQQTVAGRGKLGGAVAELFPELRKQGYLALLDQVLASGQPFGAREQAMQLRLVAGALPTTLWLDYHYQPLLDATGQATGILIFGLDVTDKVLARQQVQTLNAELQASNAALQHLTQEAQAARAEAERQRGELARLFEQAPVAITVMRGSTYTVELANPTVQRLLGRSQHQLANQNFMEVFPELANQGFEQLLDGVMSSGVPYTAASQETQYTRHGRLETVYWDYVLGHEQR